MKKNFLKRWVMITIIASFAGIWPEIGIAQDALTYFQIGTEHLRLGELDEALTALTQAINLKSDYAAAYNNRGLTYYEKDANDTRARDDYLMAIQHDPTNEEAKNNLGIFYFKQGDYANAKIYYTAALPASQAQEKPYHADVYNNLGIIYAKEGMIINAEDAYNNAIRITTTKNLDYTNAYYNRGNLYYEQKKYDQAIADYTVTIDFFKSAKDMDYDYSDAYYNRGLCYFNKNQYDQAIAEYQEAININPSFIWAHYSKGYVHFLKGEYSQALAEFQQVLNLPDDFRAKEGAHSYAQLGMGLVYHKQGHYEQSLEKVKASCSLGNASACNTLKDLGQL
ncbi:MAG: tetratricopeptide repeat protein [Deltaproteobacteria bacterium]|nr:tetratricopeptide repeat protein [Deltaproteobacteria bacterium]